MMPKLNGLQLLEKLKEDHDTKLIPVFMLTNLANKADAVMATRLGAVSYLIKSNLDPKQIVNVVRDYFKNP